ncbi:MAG: bcp 1 [Mucilaginibacter sp.]|nr:bcp 1 [Mucilaginibacter sp.]
MSISNEIPSYQQGKNELNEHISSAIPADVKTKFDQDAALLTEQFQSPLKLRIGDKAPLFELPNAAGHIVKLNDLLNNGPVVLTFYRGTWCPFCNLVLSMYQKILPQIKERGASLVAISAQTPDHSLTMKEKNELDFEVLSDAHNEVARQYTSIFKNNADAIAIMKQLGLDFHSFYSDDSGGLPVPALYIIDKQGIVIFAGSKGGDYRERTEPAEIIEALDNIH